ACCFEITLLFPVRVTTVRIRENPGVRVLINVLPPELGAEPSGDHVRILHHGQARLLRPFWVGEGFPIDVRRAMGEMSPESNGTTPVITARRLSPGAVEILNRARMSWADAAGYAQIHDPAGVYLARLKPKPLSRS